MEQMPAIKMELITTVAAAASPVDSKNGQKNTNSLIFIVLRMITLMFLVALLTIHMRCMRVFIWEQYVSGGILVSYCMSHLGLVLCSYTENCKVTALETYFCAIGSVMFGVNAVVIYCRWHEADDLTRILAELLATLGVKIRAQVMTKVILSTIICIGLLCDVILCPVLRLP